MVTDCETEQNRTVAIHQDKAREMRAYRSREHNENKPDYKKKKKTNDNRSSEECDARRSERRGSNKNSVRAKEDQMTAVERTKQHEEEEDTGIRQKIPA